MGLGIIGFADALQELKPDLLMVLGDRFEIFAAVSAALVARIPFIRAFTSWRPGTYSQCLCLRLSQLCAPGGQRLGWLDRAWPSRLRVRPMRRSMP